MSEPKPNSASAWADDEGTWLELKMDSDLTIKIPVDVEEAEKLASELAAAADWKKRNKG